MYFLKYSKEYGIVGIIKEVKEQRNVKVGDKLSVKLGACKSGNVDVHFHSFTLQST